MAAAAIQQNAIEVERVGSVEALVRLQSEWEAVQCASSYEHVLLDHRWVRTWFEVFGDDKIPCVLVLREAGTAVGLLPLVLSRGRELFPARRYQVHMADEFRFTRVPSWARLVPIRRLTYPLSGALANRRGHFLFDREDPTLYARAIAAIEALESEWDLAVLEGFPAGSTAEGMLNDAIAGSGLKTDGRSFTRETLYATLPETMDDYLAGKTRHFRKRLKEEVRRAERRFPDLRVRAFRGADIDAGMDHLLDLETRSWKMKRDRARTFYIGPEPKLQAFHRKVARAFAEHDEAVVYIEFVGGRAVAGIQCLGRRGRLATIVTFMDTEYSRHLSTAPMYRRLVADAIELGYREIDFCGNTANLSKWADGVRRSGRVFLYNRRPHSQFLRTLSVTANRAHRGLSTLRGRGRKAASA